MEDGYRYSRVKIISWIIAMVLGVLSWYGIYLVGKEVYSHYKPVQYRYSVHLI
jgi:hypothetical protein